MTASNLFNSTLLSIARLSGFRAHRAVEQSKVETAVRTEHDLANSTKTNRLIGFSFRNQRARYCGARRQAMTIQIGRGQWGLTEAGVERARQLHGKLEEGNLVILNMGLGRDSMTMLALLIDGELLLDGKKLTCADVDAVVFSDTGAEWSYTLALIPRVRAICEANGLRFIVLNKPSDSTWRPWATTMRDLRHAAVARGEKFVATRASWAPKVDTRTIEQKAAQGGYHLRPPILDDFGFKGTIAARADKSCTGNHKVLPIRRVIQDLANEKYGVPTNTAWSNLVRKGKRLPHVNLVGIAADEGHRLGAGGDSGGCFSTLYTTERYPLVEANIAKDDETPILEAAGLNDTLKSGCWMCPFQPIGQFWALRETEPATWAAVVAYEAVALARNAKLNIGGKTDITTRVDAWRTRNPLATVETVLTRGYTKGCGKKAA